MAIYTKFDQDNDQQLFADCGQRKIYRVLAVNSDGSIEDLTDQYEFLKPMNLHNLMYFTTQSGWVLGDNSDVKAFNEISLAFKQGLTWDAVQSAFDAAAFGLLEVVEIVPTAAYRAVLVSAGLLPCPCEDEEG